MVADVDVGGLAKLVGPRGQSFEELLHTVGEKYAYIGQQLIRSFPHTARVEKASGADSSNVFFFYIN
jgi:hypothetical protein